LACPLPDESGVPRAPGNPEHRIHPAGARCLSPAAGGKRLTFSHDQCGSDRTAQRPAHRLRSVAPKETMTAPVESHPDPCFSAAPPAGGSAADYQRAVRRLLAGILALNLAVTLTKFAVGAMTGSIAVLADAFNALVDASSNVIGLLGLHAGSEPPDAAHPYGRRKYETIATLGIGGLMLLAGWEVLQDTVERLRGSPPPVVTPTALILLLATLPLNAFIVWYEGRRGRALRSDILLADAMSTRINILVSLAALVGLCGARFGWPWLDVVVALGIVAYVVQAAYRIIRDTTDVLTDSAAVDPHAVEDIARRIPGVWFVHRVRSRGREDDVHLDLRVKVDPAMSTDQAHAIASEVERQLKTQVAGVVDALVHIEPGGAEPLSEWDAIAVRLRAIADGLGLGVHNIHLDVVDGGYLLDVDIEVDAALSLAQSHTLASEFEARARAALPKMTDIITHIEPSLPANHSHALLGDDAAGLRQQIAAIVNRISGPDTAHHIVLRRGRLPERVDLSLHCSMAGDTALLTAHLLAEQVERELRAALPQLEHVTVHVEPPGPHD
jgi:cation diffusion facilitator family transporter